MSLVLLAIVAGTLSAGVGSVLLAALLARALMSAARSQFCPTDS